MGLTVHTKPGLVVRDAPDGIRRYCHIGSGNYNSKTARIYEDVGLLTCDPDIGSDLTQLFNFLTGYGRDATRSVRPLVSGARFFALDTDVDSWFVASPEPPAFDRRSSGGTLTALRQSPCARAPESVRAATSAIGP